MRLRSQGSASPPPDDANQGSSKKRKPKSKSPEENDKKSAQQKVDKTQDGCAILPEEVGLVLAETKAQIKLEAEKKRKHDLERIAGIKSKKGLHPLELFPKEIWDKILKHPDLCPNDRYNMCQVHPLFEDLMKSTKIQDVLLPLVLMAPNLTFLKLVLELESGSEGGHLKSRQISNLRRVSHSVKESVDKYYEEQLLRCMRGGASYLPSYLVTNEMINGRGQPGEYRFQFSSNDHPDILGRLRTFPRSGRYFSRSLLLTCWTPGEEEERQHYSQVIAAFKRDIVQLLETVGNQILFFSVDFECLYTMHQLGVTISEIYGFVRDHLALMPNLKWIKLRVHYNLDRIIGVDEMVAALQNEPQMPILRDLERVDIAMVNEKRGLRIWDGIFKANPHVRISSHYANEFISEEAFTTSPVPALALESVALKSVNIYHCSPPVPQSWDLPMLCKINNSNWNLKKLGIQMNPKYDSLDPIFGWMENFPLLEELSLTITKVTIGEVHFLKLPNLKCINLCFGPRITFLGNVNSFMSLEFLLYCQRLELIKWTNYLLDSDNSSKIPNNWSNKTFLNFQGGIGDLSVSNVWDAFPRLRGITVTDRKRNLQDSRTYLHTRQYARRELVGVSREVDNLLEFE